MGSQLVSSAQSMSDGRSTSSRLDNPNDSSQVYRWMLTELRDTNGNYIKYNYNKDDGQVYPSSIIVSAGAKIPH